MRENKEEKKKTKNRVKTKDLEIIERGANVNKIEEWKKKEKVKVKKGERKKKMYK